MLHDIVQECKVEFKYLGVLINDCSSDGNEILKEA